jgi:osmoprotectant transport system permease protein
MTAPAAFLGQFGDALQFIFTEQTGPGGAQVGGGQLLGLVWTHLELSFAAVAIAIVVGLPIGLWLGHTRRGSFVAVTVANIGRAVPSIGLVFLFFAILGAGFLNIMLALVLLAIPPILTNAYTGVQEVERDVVDAARGVGMTGLGIVRHIELPLALPLIAAGIRTSTVNVIATATLGPEGGVVTLGDPIINPTSYGESGRLGAAIVVAALAVVAELALGAVERAVTPEGITISRQARRGPLLARLPLAKRRAQTT